MYAQTVDYSRAEMRLRPSGSRRERFVPVICGGCNNERWLSVPNARAAEKAGTPCYHCASSIKGKKGYQKTVELFGRRPLLEKIRERQLEKPSSAEIAVSKILSELIAYTLLKFDTQEIVADWYLFDFSIKRRGETKTIAAVEVNGYWHKLNRENRDIKLVEIAQIPVLFLDADLAKTEDGRLQLRQQIDVFIDQHIGYIFPVKPKEA